MTPTLESFEVLSDATRALLFPESVFDGYLYPVFGTWRFPIAYYHAQCDDRPVLEELFAKRSELALTDCEHYNQWLVSSGNVSTRIPTKLRAVCTQDKASCKNFQRWHCGGCGRIWLPGSLNDPACTIRDYPWWYRYMQEEVEREIKANGGVSKTDPLIWFPTGAKRHGRTIRFDPRTTEPSDP